MHIYSILDTEQLDYESPTYPQREKQGHRVTKNIDRISTVCSDIKG